MSENHEINEKEEPTLKQVISLMQTMGTSMQSMGSSIQALASTQEKLEAEQRRMGTALGEVGQLIIRLNEALQQHEAGLVNHAEVLKSNSQSIVRLWQEAGLPIKEMPDTPPSTPVN